jgi:hypothetical protein
MSDCPFSMISLDHGFKLSLNSTFYFRLLFKEENYVCKREEVFFMFDIYFSNTALTGCFFFKFKSTHRDYQVDQFLCSYLFVQILIVFFFIEYLIEFFFFQVLNICSNFYTFCPSNT